MVDAVRANSAHWDLELAVSDVVRVRQCPLASEAHGSCFSCSCSAQWGLKLAVCGLDLAVPASIWSLHTQLRGSTTHCDHGGDHAKLEENVENGGGEEGETGRSNSDKV